MKKVLSIIFLIFLTVSCTTKQFGDFTQSFFGERLVDLSEKEKFDKKMRSYRLEAVMETNEGTMTFFLYPSAAPNNVAHFVYLARDKFYDDLPFYRVEPSLLIQAGDDKGDGTGTTNSRLDDEIVSWLNFKDAGMLAMANSGPNTNGSQFFVTLAPNIQLKGQYTIIGEVKSKKQDLEVASKIKKGDVIKKITIQGINVDDFLNNFKEQIKEWNKQRGIGGK